ncbi:two-component system response regulator [Novosphingobium sp. PC22D]|uniref:response regulator n=1 Tax=Novosphingobium sp. PC22D TaxID=1962403 RepID=UPI000BF1E59A|nr:response regulator [Novosphingobium sp. PC22D]PEQ13423.1 two-component system response regulator [Novosphingobium sp. PC22D]
MTTVLTIDDSPSIRQIVSLTLSGAGYDVLEAADGAEGLKIATERKVDVVLTDLNMPVMNGIEFTRSFRGHPAGRGVPVVLLTTESDESMKAQAKGAGATGWIQKPFQQGQLLRIMAKVAGA